MAPRALGAGGADGEVRPSLTERPPRWLPTGWIGSHLLGSRSRPRFALPPPRIHLFSSLRGMTDIRTSTPAPSLWSARATDRLHSPLHLCRWPHHSPRPRSPRTTPLQPRSLEDHHAIPEHPCSAPSRTTPDSSSSSRLDRPLALTARVLVLPKFFRSALPVQPAPGPSPAHTFHGQLRPHRHGPLRPHGLRLTTGPSPVPTLLCLALLRRPLW